MNTNYCFFARAQNEQGDLRYNTLNKACATTSNITGIINSSSFENVKIYPNPNSGDFILELDLKKSGNCQIKITNMLGQKVYEESKFVSTSNNKIPIQLLDVANGAYNVSLIIDNENYTKQIIITK